MWRFISVFVHVFFFVCVSCFISVFIYWCETNWYYRKALVRGIVREVEGACRNGREVRGGRERGERKREGERGRERERREREREGKEGGEREWLA